MAATSVEKIIQTQIVDLLTANIGAAQGRDVTVWSHDMVETYRQKWPRVVVNFPEQTNEEILDRQMKLVTYRVPIEMHDSDTQPDRATETLALLSAMVQAACYTFPNLYLAGLYVIDESFWRFDTTGGEQFGHNERSRTIDLYITTTIELGTIYDDAW